MRFERGRAFAKRVAARPLAGGGPLLWVAADRLRRGRGAVPEARVTPFTIAFTGRSGSNMLRRLLDSHPDIICHGEVTRWRIPRGEWSPKLPLPDALMRPLAEAVRRRASIDELLRMCRARNGGHRLVGVKHPLRFLGRAEMEGAHRAALADPRSKVIVVTRERIFHQALSRLRRARYGYTEALSGGGPAARLKVRRSRGGYDRGIPPGYLEPQEVDAARMVALAEELLDIRWRAQEYLERVGKPHLAITYEELVRDDRRALGRVLEHIGLPADHKDRLRSGTVKLAPLRPLSEQVSNYEELLEAARAAGLEERLLAESAPRE